jgi:hypothetical protein
MKRSTYLPAWYKAPAKRKTYLNLISALPGILMTALWSSGWLNPATTSAAFYVSAALCFLIPITNYPHAKRMRREYFSYRSAILADLAASSLTGKDQATLRSYLAELDELYHVVRDPNTTYEAVAVIGAQLHQTAQTLGRLNHWVYKPAE